MNKRVHDNASVNKSRKAGKGWKQILKFDEPFRRKRNLSFKGDKESVVDILKTVFDNKVSIFKDCETKERKATVKQEIN